MTLNSVMAVILCYYTECVKTLKPTDSAKLVEAIPALSLKCRAKESGFWPYIIYGDIHGDHGE